MPWWKLWPENFEALKPALDKPDLTREMKNPQDSGMLSSCTKRGDSGGHLMYSKGLLRAPIVHVCSPRALVILIATSCLNGSIFDEGTVRTTCNGAAMEGMNCMLLLVM